MKKMIALFAIAVATLAGCVATRGDMAQLKGRVQILETRMGEANSAAAAAFELATRATDTSAGARTAAAGANATAASADKKAAEAMARATDAVAVAAGAKATADEAKAASGGAVAKADIASTTAVAATAAAAKAAEDLKSLGGRVATVAAKATRAQRTADAVRFDDEPFLFVETFELARYDWVKGEFKRCATLIAKHRSQMDAIVKLVKGDDAQWEIAEIVGYADRLPFKRDGKIADDSDDLNLMCSERRANAVAEYLEKALGMGPSAFALEGRGLATGDRERIVRVKLTRK